MQQEIDNLLYFFQCDFHKDLTTFSISFAKKQLEVSSVIEKCIRREDDDEELEAKGNITAEGSTSSTKTTEGSTSGTKSKKWRRKD